MEITRPTLNTPSNPMAKKVDNGFKSALANLDEVDNMLNEKEQSLKKKIFSLAKMEALVFSDPKLTTVYDDMAANGEEAYGYHYNETIMNIIFNDYVLNSSAYLQKYKMAIPKKKKRRDKSGINALKHDGIEKMSSTGTKITNIDETTTAGSAGGDAGYTGYATPAAWAKSGKPMANKPLIPNGIMIQENYLTDPKIFKILNEDFNREETIDNIGDKSDLYGNSTKQMNNDDLKIIKNDLNNKTYDTPNLNEDLSKTVEYVSDRQGENPFTLGGIKWQYVNARYPDGKMDIGVYRYGHDLVYDYTWFRENFIDHDTKISEDYDFNGVKNRDQSKTPEESIEKYKPLLQKLANSCNSIEDLFKVSRIFLNKYDIMNTLDATTIIKTINIMFKNKNNTMNIDNMNEEAESMIGDNPTSMKTAAPINAQASGLEVGMNAQSAGGGMSESEGDDCDAMLSELEDLATLQENLKRISEDRKTSSLILVDRLGNDNAKNFKSDLQHSGTKETINIEKSLEWKDQQVDVDKNPYKTAEEIEKAGVDELKNVGNSANLKGGEINKRNLTDKEVEEVSNYKLGLGDVAFDGEVGKRFEDRMKNDMGDERYKQRQTNLETRANMPLYNKGVQPTDSKPMESKFTKNLSETMITGRYKDILGKSHMFDFMLNESTITSVLSEDWYSIKVDGLGNTYANKLNENTSKLDINEGVANAIEKYKFYLNPDDKKVFLIKNSNVINESKETKVSNTEIDKMKRLLNYQPKNFVETKNNRRV